MKILDKTILKDRYEVIVVGAGLGGLSTACLLAKRGVSVLLIDRQDKPGGSCNSFKRKGVVYDTGTAMLYGFGEKGFHPFRFVLNELEEPVDMIAHQTLARMTFEGHEIIFHADIDQFLDELGGLFPGQREALGAFYAYLYKLYENIVLKNEVIVPPSEFSAKQGLRSLMSGPIAMLKMRKLLDMSVKDLLDQFFTASEVIDFFDKLCSAYCYCTSAETPAVLAATMFLDNHVGGVYSPAGGAHMLASRMEKSFERDGGQVLYRHLVDEILIHDRAAYGIRLSNGETILAEKVVANATVWNIYGSLVKPENIDPARLKWAQSLVPTYPSMVLYMVVDAGAFPAGTYPWEIFIENRKEIDSTDLTLYINSLVDHTVSTRGKLEVLAIGPNLTPWPGSKNPEYQKKAYSELKKAEAEKVLDQIESHYPNFRRNIRNLIIASPTTIERYLLKNGGEVGGPKNMLGQHMLKRLHARSDWKNLYICGDSTVMGTGAPAAVVSGVGAANVILRDMKKQDYDSRKFEKSYINFVDLPFTRPEFKPGQPITRETAWLAAAECQWCEHPACSRDCPAGIDIPGFMRRLEAGNVIGAARLIREKNPLGEICGNACGDHPACQVHCIRRSFAGRTVRIAELERKACAYAGREGWIKSPPPAPSQKVAVVGFGPSGLAAANYLNLAGFQVEYFSEEEQPGETLARLFPHAISPEALERELNPFILPQTSLMMDRVLDSRLAAELASKQEPVFLALEFDAPSRRRLSNLFGADFWRSLDPKTGALVSTPGWFACPPQEILPRSVVRAVAAGRRSAVVIARQVESLSD